MNANLPAIAGRCGLSDELSNLLEPDYLPQFGTDAKPRSGVDFKESWRAPQFVSTAIQAEALRALDEAEKALAPASPDSRRKWLGMLGILCAGRMTAQEAETKLMAYADLLAQPACVFTKASLKRAGRRFKWFPSFCEVDEFLDEEAGPLLRFVQRLHRLARAPLRLEKPHPQTTSQRKKIGVGIGQLAKALVEKNGPVANRQRPGLGPQNAQHRAEISASYMRQREGGQGDDNPNKARG